MSKTTRRIMAVLIGGFVLTAGCGPEAGAWAYFMGAGSGETVDALYELDEEGPILVLVDDPQEKLEWPEIRDQIAEKVGKELLVHDATEKVIANNALKQRRQVQENFDKLSVREIGEKLKAKQVVWIEIRTFDTSDTIADSTAAAKIEVTVKVIDPDGSKKDNSIRLWPQEVNGYPVSAEISSGQIAADKKRQDLIEEISNELSVTIAQIFYEYFLEDAKLQ